MTITPSEIRLKKDSKLLIVSFDDGSEFQYSCEYLRVHSPSAEVKGHGPSQETLQIGKCTRTYRSTPATLTITSLNSLKTRT